MSTLAKKRSTEQILLGVTSVDASGKGVWSLTVNPGDSTVVTIPYRLEYPSGLTLVER